MVRTPLSREPGGGLILLLASTHPDPCDTLAPEPGHSAPLFRTVAGGDSPRVCVRVQVALPLSIDLKASGLGTCTYEDLDELHSRYVEPLGERIVEVTSHRWVEGARGQAQRSHLRAGAWPGWEVGDGVAVAPEFRAWRSAALA